MKVNAEEPVVAQLNNRGFKEAVEVGAGASDVALTSAVFGKENGRDVAYATANGGKFNVVELQTNKLLFSEQLGEVTQVWSHSLAPDGTVYMAALAAGNEGELWSYTPSTRTVKKIGTPAVGHQLWSSAVDEEGNVYVGTYKETDGRIIQYKPSTGEFVDFGKVDDGDGSYVRSMAYHDGYLYAGLGVTGKVYRINVQTKEKEDITKNVPELIGKPIEQVKFAYDMAVAGNYLFVRFDDGQTNTLLFYNLAEQRWMDKKLTKLNDGSADDFGAFGFTQLPIHEDKAYVIYNRYITEVDLNTLELRNTGFNYPAGWRGGAIVDLGRTDLPGLSLVTLKRTGQVLAANFEKNLLTELPTVMEAKPLLLHNLGKGPDGNLYMTTYPGGPKGAQYNPKTNSFVSYSQGQAEGMAAGNGTDMYFGIYPGASIQKMNTETLEQETLFNIKDTYEQDRPYIMKFIENRLFIGTIPDYQKLGGALTIYDPVSRNRETHRNIVQDQSIVGLAYKDGLLYGSTTIRGGLDIQPAASKAKMFVWDVAAKKKVTEFELNIPELDQPPMISGLTFDQDGLLWGAVDGILFAMNPKTYEIVKYKNFYPEVKNRGMWRPVHILFGKDGLLYTDLAGKLTVVDPQSTDLKHVTLITAAPEVDFLALAEDANGNENIYFLENGTTVLKMVPVIDGGTVVQPPPGPVTEVVSVPINNASFEETGPEGDVPGWSSLFGNFTPNVSFEVSETRSKTGKNSLKVVDQAQNETVFAQTNLIPIEEGVEYTGSVNLFLEDGSASFFLRYYDEAGNQVNKDTDGVNIIHVRSGHNEWQTVTAKVVAPERAKFARLFAGTSNYFTTSGAYYDDFKLTFERIVEPEPERITVPVDLKNAGFEAALTAGAIPGWSLLNSDLASGTNYEISQSQASKGRFSLKVADTAASGSIYLQSDPQSVIPGTKYTAASDVYLEDGRASFFMRFFDASGNQVGGDTASSLVHVTSGYKQWQTVSANAVAPEGAVTVRLFAGVSNAWTTNGVYYDHLTLSYEREVQPGDPEDPMDPEKPVTYQWVKKGAKWYVKPSESGEPVTGWFHEDGYTYFLNQNGQAKTSWLQKDHQWYYFDDHGVMQTGKVLIHNQWYVFSEEGILADQPGK